MNTTRTASNRPSYYKSNEEIALLLTLRPGRTEKGRAVSAAVVARVEIAIAIETALKA